MFKRITHASSTAIQKTAGYFERKEGRPWQTEGLRGVLPETMSWNVPAHLKRPMTPQLNFYQYTEPRTLLAPTHACMFCSPSSDYNQKS